MGPLRIPMGFSVRSAYDLKVRGVALLFGAGMWFWLFGEPGLKL